MTSRALPALLAAVLATALLGGCGAGSRPSERPRAERASSTTTEAAPAAPVTVVAVGDIACKPGYTVTSTKCRQAATARLTRSIDPAYVIGLGDLQYDSGTLTAYRGSYDRSWGSLKSRTRPLPGNHEYETAGARGYYRYFGRTSPGYYAWNAGTWRVYNLNSNCSEIDCAAEAAWLRDDLEAHPRACTIMAMHHPRFSSGYEHGNNAAMARFWKVAYNHRLDVVLAGHDHDYERFVRMSPSGDVQPQRGLQSFVSGAGGKSLYHLGTRKAGSAYFSARSPGVLVLKLGAGSYSWRFRTIDGRTPDSGSRTCV